VTVVLVSRQEVESVVGGETHGPGTWLVRSVHALETLETSLETSLMGERVQSLDWDAEMKAANARLEKLEARLRSPSRRKEEVSVTTTSPKSTTEEEAEMLPEGKKGKLVCDGEMRVTAPTRLLRLQEKTLSF